MIELTELKDWLQVTETTDDALLVGLEQRAVEYVERTTNRRFGSLEEQAPVYLSGSGGRTLWLPIPPVAGTASDGSSMLLADSLMVEYETSPGVWEVVSTSDYSVRVNRLVHNSSWVLGTENYRVTYWTGYPTGSVPGEVRQLVMDLVALKYHRRGSEQFRSETIGGYSYTFGDQDVTDVDGWKVIDLWRIPVFA